MRTKIDTSEVKFRIAALPRPRQQSRSNPAQRMTPDGRPVWTVRLTAIDTGSNTSETIWVEVAGDEPKLTLDELATVHGLVYDPYVHKDTHKIVRSFRAESITVLGGPQARCRVTSGHARGCPYPGPCPMRTPGHRYRSSSRDQHRQGEPSS